MRAEALLPSSGVDPDTARQTVEEVLSRPEYAPEGASLLERAVQWIFDRLGEIGGDPVPMRGGGGGGTGLSGFIGWLFVVALVALIVWLLVRAVRGYECAHDDEVDTTDEPRRPAHEWHAEADAHEQAGRWREAVRCRYRAILAELAGRGVVQEIPGRTAGDYLAEVLRQAPVAGSAFTEVTRLFQRAWYGSRPTVAQDAQRARTLAETTLQSAGRA